MSLLGGWMLVLLLAFDLIGSPFHGHSHDLGTDGLSAQALHAAHGPGASDPAHVETVEGGSFAHSLAALVPAQLPLGKWHPVAHLSVYGPQPTSCTEVPTLAARAAWHAWRVRPAISSCQHLRPEGRAPPLLRT